MVDGGTIIISCGCWKFVDPDKWQEVQCSVNELLASWNTAYWLYVPLYVPMLLAKERSGQFDTLAVS